MNRLGPKSAQVGPTTAETCPRARPRGRFAQRSSSFWITRSGLYYCFPKSLTVCRKVLEVLFLYRAKSPTKLHTGSRNPASYTSRRGRRPMLIFGSHLILPLRSISPHSISELKLYTPLPTVTAERRKGTTCSKRFMAV
jgi:hypothetical protein